MPIENNLVENVVKSAIRNLQSKTFGGVSKESAQNAIKDTAQEVQNIANEEIYQVQRELNSVRNRSLDEIVQLTSDKDRLEISLKKTKTELDKTAKELSEVSNELRKAISTKAGKEKVLPNGHIQTTKVNRNGATMTVETLPNEQRTPILYEVTNIDGYKRRTKINPVDGKPINTFTDTHGEYLYEYLPNGAKIRKVNVKKVKTKPQVVKREVLVDNCHMCEVRESYSDGSYKTINYNPNNRKISKEVMYDNNNKVLYEIETKGENKKTLVYYLSELDNTTESK